MVPCGRKGIRLILLDSQSLRASLRAFETPQRQNINGKKATRYECKTHSGRDENKDAEREGRGGEGEAVS
jgi:hypothetical protein